MVEKMNWVPNSLIGIAGVHYAASELSRRGLIALPTTRNTQGIDLVVVNPDGSRHANIQVKTCLRKRMGGWCMPKKFKEWHGRHNYYAFIRWDYNKSQFEGFLEKSERVIRDVERKAKGSFKWWPLPTDASSVKRLRKQWDNFGIKQTSEGKSKTKFVYICSPLKGNLAQNIKNACKWCHRVLKKGDIPIAPHLYFTRFLNDSNKKERILGKKFGLKMLNFCEIMEVYGNRITKGMKKEIKQAKKLNIPIICKNSFLKKSVSTL